MTIYDNESIYVLRTQLPNATTISHKLIKLLHCRLFQVQGWEYLLVIMCR